MAKNKKLTERIEIRCSKQEKSRLKWLADIYAGGNLSAWLMYAGLKMVRQRINKRKFRESNRRVER